MFVRQFGAFLPDLRIIESFQSIKKPSFQRKLGFFSQKSRETKNPAEE